MLSGPPSGQGAGGGARTHGRRVPAYLKADSLTTVPLMPPNVGLGGTSDSELQRYSFNDSDLLIGVRPSTPEIHQSI
ncbi:hypothetical protein PoB_001630800 [Plakobranchus ocellatus]|uniref:Uncharacterized protein n=1 Tax=Plakobranchus ocellatus TaxID=259542 RepID=A0AAV3Z570_9GAST|nr:hypothetical protein PoB_001630800 [Plakobranchus ocellatus]